MKLRTRVFELYNGKYKNMTELARAMGISMGHIYNVRQGKRGINQKFIIGAMKAFPGHKLDDLFYVTDEDKTEVRDQMMSLLLRHPDMSYPEIGGIVGRSRQRVHTVARTAGLTRNMKHRYLRPDVTIERVLGLYHRNMLIKDIVQTLGCAHATVARRLRAAGISKSKCYSRGRKLDWRARNEQQ